MVSMRYTCYNLLEPPELLELFRQFPPVNFSAACYDRQMPCFYTNFGLLTTLDKMTLERLTKWPLFKLWSKKLKLSACFGGSTVTEYVPVPHSVAPSELLTDLGMVGHSRSLIVIKDLPKASPLLSVTENMVADELAQAALAKGFIEMEGQALAYVPIDFTSVDEYLSRLSAARRKDLRRKMRKRAFLDIETRKLGDAMFFNAAMLAEFYAMYLEVYAQSLVHFDLLAPEFLQALLQNNNMDGIVVLYRENGVLIGYNISLIYEKRLVDKYIGFKYPQARNANCYFISWLYNLEFALEHGISAYIAGWTDPEVKASLGAKFTFTRHLVWVKNPLLRQVFRLAKKIFEGDKQTLEAA